MVQSLQIHQTALPWAQMEYLFPIALLLANRVGNHQDRGLLDYGQYYAARTGSEVQAPDGRRVLFSATGWHYPPGTRTVVILHCLSLCFHCLSVPTAVAVLNRHGRLQDAAAPHPARHQARRQGPRHL